MCYAKATTPIPEGSVRYTNTTYPTRTPEGLPVENHNDSTNTRVYPRTSLIAAMQGSVLPADRYRLVGPTPNPKDKS